MNNGYSSATGSATVTLTLIASGTFGYGSNSGSIVLGGNTYWLDTLVRNDADFVSGSTNVALFTITANSLTQSNKSDLVGITLAAGQLTGTQARRLNTKCNSAGETMYGDTYTNVRIVIYDTVNSQVALGLNNANPIGVTFPQDDNFIASTALGSVKGAATWGLENDVNIPELNIRIDSVSVTAKSKKLKVKWSPELGQDLNAYHNLDAEVELTSIMSEQIALEIDQEVLEDLIKGATASTYYWNRRPGVFVDRNTGKAITNLANESVFGADFTGNVSMWYETLIETINDVSAQIHRKTLRGGASFIVVSPEVANILEMTSGFRGSVTHDDEKGEVGAVKVGSLQKKWDVFVNPYWPRNVILVGRRGKQFLESGYVYSPYVPLQITPTIFGIEDFVPRKGCMTRYAKKMVRPDCYGLVIVQNLLG